MKRSILLSLFACLLATAWAGQVVVVAPQGCALKTSSDWQSNDTSRTVSNGQVLTTTGAVYGDAVKVRVLQVPNSKGAVTNTEAWMWVRGFTQSTRGLAVQVGANFTVGGQDAPAGVALFKDATFKGSSRIGVLWPNSVVQTLEVAVTWRQVENILWVYAPYVKDK